MSKETAGQSDKAKALVFVITFVIGAIFGMLYMASVFNYTEALPAASVPVTNHELMVKLNQVSSECARPQTGQVTITGDDIVDALRGKQLSFIVETTTE